MNEKKIFKLNDDILFRICEFDDCTDRQSHWKEHITKCGGIDMFNCAHYGDIHFHCVKHPEVELALKGGGLRGPTDNKFVCPICSQDPEYKPPQSLRRLSIHDVLTLKQAAMSLANSEKFRTAKLIRLDDYYYPEISEKDLAKEGSHYWMSYDVKKNKKGEPLLILYLGEREPKTKAQFFIEPESKKLSHDHTNSDPLTILSRIEVKFKDGSIELKSTEEE